MSTDRRPERLPCGEPDRKLDRNLAFLGGGVMAAAILRALLVSELIAPAQVRVGEISPERRALLSEWGVRAVPSNQEALEEAEVVILAVKPYVLPGVLADDCGSLSPATMVLSIAAGISITTLEQSLPAGVPIIRVMPNTPAQVGAGAAAFCRGSRATEEHAALARRILEAGGRCVEVSEGQMDAVTGLSGSGPAYVCLIIEALADGGVRMGLPRDIALILAAQTVLGTAQLLLETGEHPAVWKDRVATPGGTTMAGLAALEAAGVRSGLIQAVEAAARRSAELGKK